MIFYNCIEKNRMVQMQTLIEKINIRLCSFEQLLYEKSSSEESHKEFVKLKAYMSKLGEEEEEEEEDKKSDCFWYCDCGNSNDWVVRLCECGCWCCLDCDTIHSENSKTCIACGGYCCTYCGAVCSNDKNCDC